VSAVVGTVLNLKNQGDLILAGLMPDAGKLILTCAVPFLVSKYGAWNMARALGLVDQTRPDASSTS
jgi:hypothetical protein